MEVDRRSPENAAYNQANSGFAVISRRQLPKLLMETYENSVQQGLTASAGAEQYLKQKPQSPIRAKFCNIMAKSFNKAVVDVYIINYVAKKASTNEYQLVAVTNRSVPTRPDVFVLDRNMMLRYIRFMDPKYFKEMKSLVKEARQILLQDIGCLLSSSNLLD